MPDVNQPWQAPVDLDNCASEPIHIPGAIQPHGVLIAVTEPDLRVAVVSANLPDWFGVAADAALGMDLTDVIGAENAAAVERGRRQDWVTRHDELPLSRNGIALVGTLHRSGPYLVIEIEDQQSDDLGSGVVRESAMALQTSHTVLDVADQAVRWIRSLTGFDRVMFYRFDTEWNGEVIAEHKRADLNTFLGLHYPSTDIPAQARELYRRNWLRLIPDIAYTPVLLVPPVAFDTASPLDLSRSTLRSVSPIHVEYLGNMGVGASMSVSVLVNGELWGLIACHHYSGAHRPGVAARNAAEFLAQLISLRVSDALEADTKQRTIDLTAIADHVAEAFAATTQWGVDDVLHQHEPEVLAVAGATGAVVATDGALIRLGATPPDDVIRAIVAGWPSDVEILRTGNITRTCSAAEGHAETASGVLAFPISSDRREFVIWFRPELIRSVDWGGDPHNAKLASTEGPDVRLSPRKSFELWRETIRGRSEPWIDAEIRAASRFARHLGAALLRRERDATTLADDLQRVMRPHALPSLDGFVLDAFYEPSGSGSIGGDWYDAFSVGDRQVAVVIGDVAGHGLPAASEMTQLRNALRAYLVDDPQPARALERLDRLMMRALPGSIATVVCAVIDTATSEMHISHAGHVPAVLISDGRSDLLPVHGDPLLGHRPTDRTQHTVDLRSGDTVVLYSDGVVERRGESIDRGMARLQDHALAVIASASSAPARNIAAAMVDGAHEDDVTLLVVQRLDRSPFGLGAAAPEAHN